jgi:NUMOD3 motif-containing protein
MKLRTHECERCHSKFDRRNGKRIYRFCSKSCAQQTIAPANRGYRSLMKKWIAVHGESVAVEMMAEQLQKRSDAARGENNPIYGTHRSASTRRKLSAAAMGVPNALKGKTFVQFYGLERGKQLAEEHSQKLKAGYASGRIKPTARSCSAPTFRGVRLRSQLEQHVIEFLERRDAITFGQSLLYEDPNTYVQWSSADEQHHTYIPDLHDTINHVVYEVKPAWCVRTPTDEMQRKMAALVASGQQCAYLTDEDIRCP